MYTASCYGHLEVVKTLIEAGANVNQRNEVSTCHTHLHVYDIIACMLIHGYKVMSKGRLLKSSLSEIQRDIELDGSGGFKMKRRVQGMTQLTYIQHT